MRSIITAFVAGAAVGAALGILFAPAEGSETREKVKEQGKKMAEEFKDQFSKGKESFEEMKKSIRQAFDELEAKAEKIKEKMNQYSKA